MCIERSLIFLKTEMEMDEMTAVESEGTERNAFCDVSDHSAFNKRLCIVGHLSHDEEVMKAARRFGVPVETSETGVEFLESDERARGVVFVVGEMEGPLIDSSSSSHPSPFRILGRTALLELVEKGEGFPLSSRPLYCHSMSGLVVCFTGFRRKDQLALLVRLVQNMGGSIRKEMSSRVTHLIAHTCGGRKYQYAMTFRVPVMSENWVFAAWEKRKETGFSAASPDFMVGYKLKLFHGAKVCFVGFPESEKKHMEDVLMDNGGTVGDITDCTHIVVESYEAYSLLKAKVVPAPETQSQHSKPPEVHPVPPQRRRSSFFHLLLSPSKCPVIREEDGPSTPHTPEPKNSQIISPSSSNSKYETPRLSFFQLRKGGKANLLSNESDIPTSTPVDDSIETSVEDSSHDEMATADEWDMCDHQMESMCPLSPGGQASLCEGTGEISLMSKAVGVEYNYTTKCSTDNEPCIPPNTAEHAMVCDEEDKSTFPVVDDSQAPEIPNILKTAIVVRVEWFWVSVQNEGCAAEDEYKFEDVVEGLMSPATSRDSLGTPTSSRVRKRKRIRDATSRIVPIDSPGLHKRRSSVSDAGLLSMSGSFLDCSGVSEKGAADEVESATIKSLSPRQQVFLELLQTETNYVGILHTIMTLIRAPLEEMMEEEGPLLDNTELKTIFGHLPPIYELHSQMLQELSWTNTHWSEAVSIGSIILKHVSDMEKAYPPFVNFFEQTKEMLNKCDQTKPRFHAFLKVCQSKPECGRQTLGELLIRPVQRLPSISLLLKDIQKHTDKSNPDHASLDRALDAIKGVMTHINEDKRRMEARFTLFSIFNDIDNFPPDFVSSHRAFVTRCDVVELSNELSGRGDALVFFLFSDILEICKRKSKTVGSLKSPNTATLRSTKHFKHVRLIPLSDIKRVFDVQDREGNCEERQNIFALKCRSNQELKEKLYSFALVDEDHDKLGFLQTLCRQLANTVCKADAAYFLAQLEYGELDIGATDAPFGTLSKAFKLASRTKMKIGRTFSFNKTPSKLKRAVSTMMSPFGSTTNLTPASQLAQMRLASCTNLNELASPSEPEALKPPMSVQPRRKNSKSSSLSMASFRHL